MRTAALAKPFGRTLQHDALRGTGPAQQGNFVACHDAGVGVGEQARFLSHKLAHGGEVFDGGCVTHGIQFFARLPVTQFRLVTEGEQRLLTPGHGAGARDREHLIRRQISTHPRFR